MLVVARHAPVRRGLVAASSGLLAAAAIAVAIAALCRRLTLNLTPSLPRGLYLLLPGRPPVRGDVVDLPMPASMAPFMAARRYLPPSYHLLKRLVGVAGDQVCIDDDAVVVNERVFSRMARRDSLGRPLPRPHLMCGAVPVGFGVVAAASPTSLDSRFFGPVPLAHLTVAAPVWTSSSP